MRRYASVCHLIAHSAAHFAVLFDDLQAHVFVADAAQHDVVDALLQGGQFVWGQDVAQPQVALGP